MDPGPDANAIVVLSGQAAGVRNNGTVGVWVRKVRWVHFLSLSKRGIMKYMVRVPHGRCNFVCAPDSLWCAFLPQEQRTWFICSAIFVWPNWTLFSHSHQWQVYMYQRNISYILFPNDWKYRHSGFAVGYEAIYACCSLFFFQIMSTKPCTQTCALIVRQAATQILWQIQSHLYTFVELDHLIVAPWLWPHVAR